MARMIFPNISVADVAKSKAFFEGLGFSFNPAFSDEQTLCMEISPMASVMMMTPDRFAGFIEGGIADTSREREMLLAISATSREEVDQLVDTALDLGGSPWREGSGEDNEFMYGRAFLDLDGHVWEVMWMDVEGATGGTVTAPEGL